MFVAASGTKLLLRQYSIAFKKSGTTIPRTELTEMGPRIDFAVRRTRPAPEELQNQSMKQAKTEKKKVQTCHCICAVTSVVVTAALMLIRLTFRTCLLSIAPGFALLRILHSFFTATPVCASVAVTFTCCS